MVNSYRNPKASRAFGDQLVNLQNKMLTMLTHLLLHHHQAHTSKTVLGFITPHSPVCQHRNAAKERREQLATRMPLSLAMQSRTTLLYNQNCIVMKKWHKNM